MVSENLQKLGNLFDKGKTAKVIEICLFRENLQKSGKFIYLGKTWKCHGKFIDLWKTLKKSEFFKENGSKSGIFVFSW